MKKEFLSILAQMEREKGLDRNVIIEAVRSALTIAARKIAKMTSQGQDAEIKVEIDSAKGDIKVYIGDEEVVSREFGRSAAQTARQVIIQKIREAEKDNIYSDFKAKEGSIVGGLVHRMEKKAVILDLMGKAEGIIPNSFLSPLDRFRLKERVKAYVYEVKKEKGVQIILSRRHEGLVRKLFDLEVPEIGEGIVEIKSIARGAGERTKIAVFSKDDKVDCVGACVGIRGSRVKNIIEELRGEKIDIVRWSDSSQVLIANALMPAKVSEIAICFELGRATVVVSEDQLSLAIGKHGQNVRLAARLTGWDIDILTPTEYNQEVERLVTCIKQTEGVEETFVDNLLALGIISVLDLEEVGPDPLVEELAIEKKVADQIISVASEEAKKIAAEKSQKQAESILKEEQDQQTETVSEESGKE